MKKRDIVLFKFPFSNMIGYKKRPCVVISDIINGDIMLCQITSKKPNSIHVKINNKCFEDINYIKINKIATVDISKIDKVIGEVDVKEYIKLTKEISKLITLRQ